MKPVRNRTRGAREGIIAAVEVVEEADSGMTVAAFGDDS